MTGSSVSFVYIFVQFHIFWVWNLCLHLSHWSVITNGEQRILKVRKHFSTFVPCKCLSEWLAEIFVIDPEPSQSRHMATNVNRNHLRSFLRLQNSNITLCLSDKSLHGNAIISITDGIIITITSPSFIWGKGFNHEKGCGFHSPLSWRRSVFVSTEGDPRCIYLPDKASQSKGCSPDSHASY